MKTIKIISGLVSVSLLAGCASMEGARGPRGPRLVGSGYSNEYEQYAEVGVEFSSVGDFVAIVSPSRWKSPVKTGGSLSWVNPAAWSDDPGRTGRILLGEAVVVGGVAVAAAAGGGGGGDGGSSGGDSGGASGGSAPGGAPPSVPSTPPPPR